MCPEDLVALVAALTIAIARETRLEDLGIYSAIFTALGDSLDIYATQCERLQDLCEEKDKSPSVC